MRAPVPLAALSFLAAAVIVAYGHITWYGDAHTFPNLAHDFIQGFWNPHLQWRAPGYPVMMILTGVLSGSLAGLIALQALLGALIPLLIYLAVAPTDRVAATIAALAAIGSFVSYQFVLTVYHCQAFMFGLTLTALLMVKLMRGERPCFMVYSVTASCLWLVALRPTGFVIAIGCAALVLLTRAAPARHVLMAAIWLAFTVASFNIYRAEMVGTPIRSIAGMQLFQSPYLYGHITDAPELAERLAERPSSDRYWRIVEEVDDAVLLQVAVRANVQHPVWTLTRLVKHTWALLVGPTWIYQGEERAPDAVDFLPLSPQHNDPRPGNQSVTFTPHWLATATPTERELELSAVFAGIYRVLIPLALLLTLIGLIGGRVPLAVLVVYAGQLVPMAFLTDPQFRYQNEMVPLLLMGAGFGVATIKRRFARS